MFNKLLEFVCRSSLAIATLVRPLKSAPASNLQLIRRIPKKRLVRNGDKDLDIWFINYNSAKDELLFVDDGNQVVRSNHLREKAGDLCDVYKVPCDMPTDIWSVCHMSESDTARVFIEQRGG